MNITNKQKPWLLAALSGVLLAVSFLFAKLFFLVWIAFVPLLFSLKNTNALQAYRLGLICGIIVSILASYWINDFIKNLKGYGPFIRYPLSVLFWLYSAHLIALITTVFQWLRSHLPTSDFFLFPLIVTVVFATYPLLFSIQLGATQSHFPIALQGLDITSIYGLDFVIALSNILVFKYLIGRFNIEKIGSLFAFVIITIWFIYGVGALQYWDKHVLSWEISRIGIIQPNENPSINIPDPISGYSYAYPPEMALSKELARGGVELIIWPETRFKGYFQKSHVNKAFREQAISMNTPFIFQDIESVNQNDLILKFNTSVYINPKGQEEGKYRKIKRVPIGEYLPVFDSKPAVKSFLERHLGNFFSDFKKGDYSTSYTLGQKQLIPLICYEAIFPEFVAQAIRSQTSSADNISPVLIVQSSNGWFGETRQPYQHFYASALRSIENRVPMIHAVNNGPSGVISPSGRILFQSPYHKAGGYIVDLPISHNHKRTFYTRYPWLFIYTVKAVLLAFILRATFYMLRKIASNN